jgi:hypothetical protein
MKKSIAITLLFGLAAVAPARAQTVDCLVAVVNGQPVTLADLRIAREFGLPAAAGSDGTPMAVLDALVDQKIVLEVAREPVAISGDDLNRALDALRNRLGSDAFEAKLRAFGLTEADLYPLLADQIRYDKVVSNRFSPAIPVLRGEAEQYYREVYVPERKARGLAPEEFEKARPEIESRLREKLKAKKVAEWVKSLRGQAEVRIDTSCLTGEKESTP